MKKKPLLYLLPGLDGTGMLLEKFTIYARENFTPIIINYPEESLSYEELSEYVISQLPKDEKFSILGESFGGPLALNIALKKQKYIENVILCATFLDNPNYNLFGFSSFAHFIPLEYMPIEWFESFLFTYRNDENERKEFKKVFHSVPSYVIKNRMNQAFRAKTPEKISSFKKPIIYLMGKHDLLILNHNYERLKEFIPHLNKVELDTGHMVLQTKPKECVKIIESFMLN